jgi:hypothetical protein
MRKRKRAIWETRVSELAFRCISISVNFLDRDDDLPELVAHFEISIGLNDLVEGEDLVDDRL